MTLKRDKDNVPAKIERIEYDPNRTAHIALLLYADGERRYIIAPKGVQAGEVLYSGSAAPIKAGNCLPVRNIPVGSVIHASVRPGARLTTASLSGSNVVAVSLFPVPSCSGGEKRPGVNLSSCSVTPRAQMGSTQRTATALF